MKKKGLALMLVSVMLVGMLAACGGTNSGAGNNTNTTPATTSTAKTDEGGAAEAAEWTWPLADKKEVSIWLAWTNDYANDPNELLAIQQIEKNTNVHVNWQTVNGTEAAEKFGLMLVSGNYADIMRQANSYYSGGMEKGVQDGVFLEMTDLVDKYMPNYKERIASVDGLEKDVMTDDHRMVGVWTLASDFGKISGERVWGGPAIREDWLNETGLAVPVTIADWDTALRAIKANHPDLEAPLMTGQNGYNAYGAWTTAYGVGYAFYKDGNTVKYGPMEDGYKAYVEQMRQWYKDGILDPNFITNNATIMGVLDYIGAGKCAASPNLWGHTAKQLTYMGYNNDENFNLVAAEYPVMNAGDTPECLLDTSATVKECNAISAKAADKELVLRYLDYWYTDECMVLDSMGIENDSYVITDGQYHLGPVLRGKVEDGTVNTISQAMSLWTLGTSDFGLYNWGMFEVQNEDDLSAMNACDVWNSAKFDLMLPSTMTSTDAENTEFTSLYTDIETLANENTVKFITGEQSMDQWDAFQNQLKQYGVERCIELKQAALDRYNAR